MNADMKQMVLSCHPVKDSEWIVSALDRWEPYVKNMMERLVFRKVWSAKCYCVLANIGYRPAQEQFQRLRQRTEAVVNYQIFQMYHTGTALSVVRSWAQDPENDKAMVELRNLLSNAHAAAENK